MCDRRWSCSSALATRNVAVPSARHRRTQLIVLLLVLLTSSACKAPFVVVDRMPSRECLYALADTPMQAGPIAPPLATAGLLMDMAPAQQEPLAQRPLIQAEQAIDTVRQGFEVRRTYQNHDCQELIEDGVLSAPKFVTRAELYAHLTIEARQNNEFEDNGGRALPVAYLFNITERAYDPLSLPTDDALCVFAGLQQGGAIENEDDWFAALASCNLPSVAFDDAAIIARYQVRRLTYAGLQFDDYPPVVRWHWDKRGIFGGRQAMGAKCGSAWCVIGKKKPKIDERAYGSTPQETVPGWRDEQYLAEKNSAGNFRVGKRRIVIVPDPTHNPNQNPYPDSVRVARVYLDKRSEYYESKFGFQAGNRPNEIWLKMTGENAFEATVRLPDVAEGRIIPVKHHQHPIGALTARWFWTFSDEHTWTPCPAGCCETNPPE